MSAEGPRLSLLGWLFQLRHWWAGMIACFGLAVAISPSDPLTIGMAFWLLALGYFLGVAARAWWIGRKALKELARRRRDYSSSIK